jgi:hypothetical protein
MRKSSPCRDTDDGMGTIAGSPGPWARAGSSGRQQAQAAMKARRIMKNEFSHLTLHASRLTPHAYSLILTVK